MNVLLTRFCLLFIFLLSLPYSLPSYGKAYVSGKLQWEDRNGYVYILSNTMTATNSGGTVPCPGGCYIVIDSMKSNYPVGDFPSSTTLADLVWVLRLSKGLTSLESGSGLCLSLFHSPPTLPPYVQDTPAGCFDNPSVSEPPTNPPPPPLSCSISGGTINHGQLANTDVDRHSASSNVTVNCNRKANVQVRVSSYNATNGITLNGPGTLKSLISIDGVSAETGSTKSVDTSRDFVVRSELRGVTAGMVGGAYSGSLVLVATIM